LCRIKDLKGVKQQITPSSKDLRRKLSEGEGRKKGCTSWKRIKIEGEEKYHQVSFQSSF